MLKAFYWMFYEKEFKKHFFSALFFMIILYSITSIILLPSIEKISNLIVLALNIIFWCVSILYIMGYFWNLTDAIINRSIDIKANNIYDGRIKECYLIQLPELSITKNIWRGIASFFAINLLMLPFDGLIYLGLTTGAFETLPPYSKVLVGLFFTLFYPALLWNYALRNSVIAVWNIRKAIYIMGNYPLKYFINTLLIFIILTFSYSISYYGEQIISSGMKEINVYNIIICIIIIMLLTLKDVYLIFVNAYLLGTYAPISDT